MANDAKPGTHPPENKPPQERSSKEWAEILFTPDRVAKWVKGEMTLAELSAVSGPEMLEMAVIGFSMYEQGRYDDAKVIFDALCALDPRESYYRTALGAVHLAQENLPLAEQLFNEALRINAKDIASYVNRGEVFLRRGKILEAAQDFKKAVELDPDNKDPLTRRARLLAAAALQTLEAVQKERSQTGKPAAKLAAPKPVTAAAAARAAATAKGSDTAAKKK